MSAKVNKFPLSAPFCYYTHNYSNTQDRETIFGMVTKQNPVMCRKYFSYVGMPSK